ncbi:MAG: helix-turn-helix transcriptional regulator [Nitrospiraceae bacterium]|nr:helix-turn-helix transcriptional regulator [Nitrospiraceae bacterium]
MENAIRKKLGEKIRQLRKLRELTQEQLGEKAGISYKFIGEVERGDVNPSLDSLVNISKALRVGVKELFPNENDLITGFSHEELQIIKQAVKLLNSRLNVKRAKA